MPLQIGEVGKNVDPAFFPLDALYAQGPGTRLSFNPHFLRDDNYLQYLHLQDGGREQRLYCCHCRPSDGITAVAEEAS